MFDNFIPADSESPHAAPANDCSQEGVRDDANLGNNDTSVVGSPPLLPPDSPHPLDAIVLASEVTNTECESQNNSQPVDALLQEFC
jgi:hypothetical protein